MYSLQHWRTKNNINMHDHRQFTMERYYTDAHQKRDIQHSLGEDILNNLHLLPDPLKKNLADSVITLDDKPRQKTMLNVSLTTEPPKMAGNTNRELPHSPYFGGIGGISSFFSGVLNAITGAMANLRPKPHAEYYDCFDDLSQQGAPQAWHSSNIENQNKPAQEAHSKSDMNIDCRAAAAQCEEKLNKVRLILATKPVETPKLRIRRPKRQFVEPGLVEEQFEDAFTNEDFASINISNNLHIEYISPPHIQEGELYETVAQKIKTEIATDNVKIGKPLHLYKAVNLEQCKENDITGDTGKTCSKDETTDVGHFEKVSSEQLVLSCEEKLSKLKLLLPEKNKNKAKITMPVESDQVKEVRVPNENHHMPAKRTHCTKNKNYKNPNRTTEKRKKSRLKQRIHDDYLCINKNSGEISTMDHSPLNSYTDRLSNTPNTQVDYFDEVAGRFYPSSTNDDPGSSFQIVYNDSPKESRLSECDSEDSFIVFEGSPNSCYTSNDVFGDTDEEYTDSESEISDAEDSMPITKLPNNMFKTCSDLTNGSLYEDQSLDEIDCAVRSVADIPSQEEEELTESETTGVLLNDTRKLLRRKQPPKKVHFSAYPPKVHVMYVWAFAARQARAGDWERCGRDRDRFKRRIADIDVAVSWVLQPAHRSRVMFQRFMPWWNAQKRLANEQAKLAKEEELRRKKIEESLKQETQLNGNDASPTHNDSQQNENFTQCNGSKTDAGDNDNAIQVITDNVDMNNEVKSSDANLKIVPVNEKFIDLRTQLNGGSLPSA